MLDFVKNILWNYMFIPLFLIVGVASVAMIIIKKGAQRGEGKSEGDVSPVQTLFMNLASTIGTGNIVGVSLAIAYGGAGAVFWMWVAAILGMAVSYCENALGIQYKNKNSQPIGYMPHKVSKAFAAFCIVTSFGIGNLVQSNSAASALYTGFGVKKWLTGGILALLSYLIIRGGLKGITKFTDFFVPIMSGFYIISALGVILINAENLLRVFEEILSEALSVKAFVSGSVANGIARGVMSGEAGVGSTVILSSRSNAKSPHEQGKIGATSIFIDTIVICTLTALAILSSNAASTQSAFYNTLGRVGGGILDLSITFFAFTTVVGWSYFGIECTRYLFGEKKQNGYKLLYAIAVFLGSVMQLEVAWAIGDISCALMALPNLCCVLFSLGKIKNERTT